LPLPGYSAATTSQTKLASGLRSYARLLIRTEAAEPDYVARLFNTPLGRAVRDAAKSGVRDPIIRKRLLFRNPLFLPSIETQRLVLKGEDAVLRLKNTVRELQESLWTQPRKVRTHLVTLAKMEQKESFESWLDTLPFPLASPLRRYWAVKDDPREAYKTLIGYYEVLATFLATIHISAFLSGGLLQEKGTGLSEAIRKSGGTFDRPTFNTWIVCAARLAKQARRLRDVNPQGCQQIYRLPDQHDLGLLLSSDVAGSLSQVNSEVRNHDAHGGLVTRVVAQRYLRKLEAHLDDVRSLFGDFWRHYQLTCFESCSVEHDGYMFTMRCAMGDAMPFRVQKAMMSETYPREVLCMWMQGERKALKLLPFVVISEEHRGSYVFNGMRGPNVVLKSYDCDKEPESVGESKLVRHALDQVRESLGVGRGRIDEDA